MPRRCARQDRLRGCGLHELCCCLQFAVRQVHRKAGCRRQCFRFSVQRYTATGGAAFPGWMRERESVSHDRCRRSSAIPYSASVPRRRCADRLVGKALLHLYRVHNYRGRTSLECPLRMDFADRWTPHSAVDRYRRPPCRTMDRFRSSCRARLSFDRLCRALQSHAS